MRGLAATNYPATQCSERVVHLDKTSARICEVLLEAFRKFVQRLESRIVKKTKKNNKEKLPTKGRDAQLPRREKRGEAGEGYSRLIQPRGRK